MYDETIPDELSWNESGGNLPEGLSDPNLTSNEAEIPSVANPSATDIELEELESEKKALLSQITQEADPQNFRVLQERLELLTEKIEILTQKMALEEQRTAAERALLAATTEEERALFTDQINLINTQLSGLDTSEIDAQLSETEETVSTRPTEESPPSLSPPNAENTDNSFPQNASLPKTGIEDLNDGETFSLFFPTILGLMLIVIIASSMVAAHKRS